MISPQQVQRVLAHLVRNEGVAPDAIQRAVASAADMRPTESVALEGGEYQEMRHAFVIQCTTILESER